MSMALAFEERLSHSAQHMNINPISATISELKALSKDISNYLTGNKIQDDDKLSEMQITIFNNLACLYEKKGKYQTSLYHLQIAEELENKYFLHKYRESSIPPAALEKLSTTYSNLSAIQSKLGNYKQALLNAQFAINILSKNSKQKHKSVVYLNYNYGFLLERVGRYEEAVAYAIEGLKEAKESKNKLMTSKFESLSESLKQKIAKREDRRIREMRKYLSGEIGIVKTTEQVEKRTSGPRQDTSMHQSDQKQAQVDNRPQMSSHKQGQLESEFNINTLKEYLKAEKKYFPKTRSRQSQQSYKCRTLLNRVGKLASYSSISGQKGQKAEEKTIQPRLVNDHLINKHIVEVQMEGEMWRGGSFYGRLDRSKGRIRSNVGSNRQFNKTMKERQIDLRIKSRKHQLQEQISELNQKNVALEKIIDRIYSSEKGSN